MNNQGFALRSFLVIIGLSMVVVLTVFLIQRRDSRTASVTALYERYLQNQSIEGSEGLLSEEMISTITEVGPPSILCIDIIPDNVVIDNIEEGDKMINVFLNYLEGPIRLVTEDDGNQWKIVRIECPSVDLEAEVEEEISVVGEEEIEVEGNNRVPEIPVVSKAKEDLSGRLNVDSSEIELMTVETVIFSDSTLGTSSPGEVYDQKLTPGYLIILSANGKEYRYHADETRVIFIL